MRFFAESFSRASWKEQLGCMLTLLLPLLAGVGMLGAIVYGAYWLGTRAQ